MELKRLTRVLRERWRAVVLVALVGLLAGLGLTSMANREVDPRFAAEIPVRFDPEEGETAEDVATRVTEANQLALLATQDVALANPTAAVFPDSTAGLLVFSAEGDSPENALAIADAMVRAYFNNESLGGGDISSELEALEAEAVEVTEELQTLSPGLGPLEQALVSQHDLFDQLIAGLQGQIVSLTINGALEEAEDPEAIARLQARLDQAIEDRAQLPPRPASELSPVEELQRSALQRRLDLLRTQYENLSLRAMGVGSAGIREPAEIVNLTPDPANPIVNGAVGLLGGIALALAALIFITRSRRELWLPEDLPIPLLGEVPMRKTSSTPGPLWYDTTFGGPRKESIQALRTAVDSLFHSGSNAIAIADHRAGSEAVHALAADLAASFATSGRSVLLIDTDFGGDSELAEFDVGEPTLSSILSAPVGPKLEENVSRALGSVVFIRTDLAIVAAGSEPQSPADALAGPGFRELIVQARAEFDLVIAVAGEALSAAAQVMMQRLGTAIVATAPGKTTIPRINAVLGDLRHQRVELPGVVFLDSSESRVASRPSRSSVTSSREEPVMGPALDRLGSYPFPGSKRVEAGGAGSLRGLSTGLSAAMDSSARSDDGESLGRDVLKALSESDRDRSYNHVGEYVVARVEDMLTAVSGQADVSDALIDRVTDYGFIPITPINSHPTVGEWLLSEIRDEVGERLGLDLAGQIAAVLGGDRATPAESVNQWIGREFFSRHLQRSDRQPEVWQLESSLGTIQLLVSARRLTERRISLMSTEVVRRKIDELERFLKRAQETGDAYAIDDAQHQLKEIHAFGITLTHLLGGSGEGQLVYPWRRAADANPIGWKPVWSEGIRPNIAPLQRLGLLPEPVLTEEEMNELVVHPR